METHVTPPNAPEEQVLSGRITRLDRGWSTVLLDTTESIRVRNIGVEVAVGDMLLVSPDFERIDMVQPRRSALTRRN